MIKVCKFGGTSMADGPTMQRVARIVESDPSRRYLVVSAPGKRYSGDSKVTDLLYAAHAELMETGECGADYKRVEERFQSIAYELGLALDIKALLKETEAELARERREEFTASRGEYLTARIMASYLGAAFIDAREVIKFDERGQLDPRSYGLIREALKGKRRAVFSGFYGEDAEGRVHTFSRGGSDI